MVISSMGWAIRDAAGVWAVTGTENTLPRTSNNIFQFGVFTRGLIRRRWREVWSQSHTFGKSVQT